MKKGNFRGDRERFRGFMQAMEDHGLEVSDEYVIYNGESGAENSRCDCAAFRRKYTAYGSVCTERGRNMQLHENVWKGRG